MSLDFTKINLEDNVSIIDEKCEVIYELLTGKLTINDISCNKVMLENKYIDVTNLLNDALKNEY